MIIDIHTHCFPDNLAPKAIPILARRGGVTAHTDGTVNGLKDSMHNAGIGVSVIQHIATKPEQTIDVNRWAAKVQDKDILSFGTIHPDFPGWREEIKWLSDAGMKGVKLHPDYQGFFVDEPRLFPIYEALFNSGLILLFHAGIDIGLPDPCHCTPARLKKVLDAFPGSRMVAAHMGGYKCWDDVERYLLDSGIYFDTSFSYNDLGPEGMERLIKGHGAEKVLFGTDSPWTDQSVEIAKIKSLDLSIDEINMILGGNARSLLNL